MVFCPGGSVEPTAYAPLARDIAGKGYSAVVIKLPPPAAGVEESKRDGVARIKVVVGGEPGRRWVVAGHSLGGAIAAKFAHDHPSLPRGIVLAGTTHPRDFDLSKFDRPVTKVMATNDGVASVAQSKRNERLLPKHTRWVAIEGGNHVQFGWYGPQPGDRPATVGREKQQEAFAAAIVDMLGAVGQD